MMRVVSALAGFDCFVYYHKVILQRFACSIQPAWPSSDFLCPLPVLPFVQPVWLLFPTAAFGRSATPAFFHRGVMHRRPTPSKKKSHLWRVPPDPRHPDIGRRGAPLSQAVGYPRGYAARQRASRCEGCAPDPPYGQACLPVSVSVLPSRIPPFMDWSKIV